MIRKGLKGVRVSFVESRKGYWWWAGSLLTWSQLEQAVWWDQGIHPDPDWWDKYHKATRIDVIIYRITHFLKQIFR